MDYRKMRFKKLSMQTRKEMKKQEKKKESHGREVGR